MRYDGAVEQYEVVWPELIKVIAAIYAASLPNHIKLNLYSGTFIRLHVISYY